MNLRIKTGQLPGDLSKRAKQKLLEADQYTININLKHAKALKKHVRMSERAILKRRTRIIIVQENDFIT